MRSDKAKCCVCLFAGMTLLSSCGPLDETDELPSPEIAEQSSMLVSLSNRVGDWTDLCDESYFTAHGLPNPWKDINRLGIDLGDASCQDLQRDWEIYNGFFQPVGVPNSNTYFSLYNRRVGALRTFMWVPSQQDAPGQYYSVDLFVGDGAMNKVFDHTLLSYDGGGPAYTWAERTNAAKNLDRNYLMSVHASDHWIVEDTYLGFDPFAHGSKLYYFDYLVYSHDVGQIKMTGSITNPGVPGQAGLISTATKAMKKAGSGFSESKKGYGDMVDGIRDAGGFATDTMKMPAVGKILTTVADKAAAFNFGGPGLGTVVAATELVTGFLGWVNGSQAGLSSSVISLSGDLSFNRNVAAFKIPLANSTFSAASQSEWSQTYAAPGDRNLGLYAYGNTPRIKLYYVDGPQTLDNGRCTRPGCPTSFTRTYYITVEDPHCYMNINPASGALLTSIKVRPELTIDGAFLTDEFQPSEAWNRRRIGTARVKGSSGSPAPKPAVSSAKLKLHNTLDIGRFQFMESVNSYDAASLSASAVSAPPTTGYDFSWCGMRDHLGFALDGSQHGTGFYQDGPNWYSVIDAPGAVGESALASGHIGDNEAAVFGTNFTGSSVSFNWRVSCESGYDRLFFYIDGAEVGSLTGETGWVSFHKDLPPGAHNVQWAYVKDGSLRSGEDRGMLDNLVLR